MKEEFVNYNQALKLKALGFDEPCFFAFDNCSTPMRCSDLRTNEQKFNGVNYNSSSYTSQPTFSQVFRWFREKYSWTIEIKQVTNSNWSYTLNNFPKERTYYGKLYDTYEEAELACLDKLIEIVESKSE